MGRPGDAKSDEAEAAVRIDVEAIRASQCAGSINVGAPPQGAVLALRGADRVFLGRILGSEGSGHLMPGYRGSPSASRGALWPILLRPAISGMTSTGARK